MGVQGRGQRIAYVFEQPPVGIWAVEGVDSQYFRTVACGDSRGEPVDSQYFRTAACGDCPPSSVAPGGTPAPGGPLPASAAKVYSGGHCCTTAPVTRFKGLVVRHWKWGGDCHLASHSPSFPLGYCTQAIYTRHISPLKIV